MSTVYWWYEYGTVVISDFTKSTTTNAKSIATRTSDYLHGNESTVIGLSLSVRRLVSWTHPALHRLSQPQAHFNIDISEPCLHEQPSCMTPIRGARLWRNPSRPRRPQFQGYRMMMTLPNMRSGPRCWIALLPARSCQRSTSLSSVCPHSCQDSSSQSGFNDEKHRRDPGPAEAVHRSPVGGRICIEERSS